MVQGDYALNALKHWLSKKAPKKQISKIKRKITIEAANRYLSCYFTFFSLI